MEALTKGIALDNWSTVIQRVTFVGIGIKIPANMGLYLARTNTRILKFLWMMNTSLWNLNPFFVYSQCKHGLYWIALAQTIFRLLFLDPHGIEFNHDVLTSIFTSRVSGRGNIIGPVCVCVCLGVLRAHYTPLQRYMGYLFTRKAQYAPPRRKMHHGAQGRLCFLKNSGDPDDFLRMKNWWCKSCSHTIASST